jgi:hypothetical protein
MRATREDLKPGAVIHREGWGEFADFNTGRERDYHYNDVWVVLSKPFLSQDKIGREYGWWDQIRAWRRGEQGRLVAGYLRVSPISTMYVNDLIGKHNQIVELLEEGCDDA